jgi:hypothetical protein
MSKYARGLVFAMEELEAEDAPKRDEDAELELVQEGGDIDSEMADIDDGLGAVDDAQDDIETLGDIQDVMEESVEEGEGLSEGAAEMAEIAIESIYRRLGIRNTRPMPSLESFGSSNTRVHATKIAMEANGEMMLKLKNAAISLIKALVDKIVELWNKLTNWYKGQLAKQQDIIKELEKIKSDKNIELYSDAAVDAVEKNKFGFKTFGNYFQLLLKGRKQRKAVSAACSAMRKDLTALAKKKEKIDQDALDKIIESHTASFKNDIFFIIGENENIVVKGMSRKMLANLTKAIKEAKLDDFITKESNDKMTLGNLVESAKNLFKFTKEEQSEAPEIKKAEGETKAAADAIAEHVESDPEGAKLVEGVLNDVNNLEAANTTKTTGFIKTSIEKMTGCVDWLMNKVGKKEDGGKEESSKDAAK